MPTVFAGSPGRTLRTVDRPPYPYYRAEIRTHTIQNPGTSVHSEVEHNVADPTNWERDLMRTLTRGSSAVGFSDRRRRRGMSALRGEGTSCRCSRWYCDGSKLGDVERTRSVRVGAALPRLRGGIRARHHRGPRCWSNRTGIRGRAARAGRHKIDQGISGRLPSHHRLPHRP
jgi:hypothetical protein